MSKSGEKCTVCSSSVPGYDGVFLTIEGKQKFHCNRCYNRLLSEMHEMPFEHLDFQPVTLTDADGEAHEFHFTTRILPTGISMEALEIRNEKPEGYEFQVIGPLATDVLALFGQLFERIRKALSLKHLEMTEHGLHIANGDVVRGMIDCDDENVDRIPLLMIDGKPVTWEQFGRMLMSYEGWNFKLEIFDRSESR